MIKFLEDLNLIHIFFLIFFIPSFVLSVASINYLIFFYSVYFVFNYSSFILETIKLNLKISLIFLLFSIYLIFSSLLSEYKFHSLESSLLYFYYLIYVIIFIYLFSSNEKYLSIFLFLGLTTSLILCIDALYELIIGTNFLGYSSINGRIAGFFNDRWVIGRFLIFILPIYFGVFCIRYNNLNKLFKIFFIISFFFMFTVIIFSGERAAFLSLVIYVFFIMSYLIRKIKTSQIFLLTIFFPIFFSIPFIFSETSERLMHNVIIYATNFDLDINQYLSMWLTSIKIFFDNPIIGIGPNNYRYICNQDIYNISIWSCSTHPHNVTLQILSETGLIGFFFVYSVFLFFFYEILKDIFSKKFSLQMVGIYSLKLAIIIYLFPLMISGNFFLSWYGFIYYLPISLIYVFRKNFNVI